MSTVTKVFQMIQSPIDYSHNWHIYVKEGTVSKKGEPGGLPKFKFSVKFPIGLHVIL